MEDESFMMAKKVVGFGIPSALGLMGLYSIAVLLPGDPLHACDAQPGVNVTAQPCPCWALSPVRTGAREWQEAHEPMCDPMIVAALATACVIFCCTQLVCKGLHAWHSDNASRALDMRTVGMMGSRAESPQRREGLWLRVWGCMGMGVLLLAACGYLVARRHWVEGGYALSASLPAVLIAWDAMAMIKRIDRQGFLPVTLVTNRF